MSGLELAGVVAGCRFENADGGRNGGPLQQSFAIYDIEDDLEATRKALAVNFLGPHTPCPTHSIVIKRIGSSALSEWVTSDPNGPMDRVCRECVPPELHADGRRHVAARKFDRKAGNSG